MMRIIIIIIILLLWKIPQNHKHQNDHNDEPNYVYHNPELNNENDFMDYNNHVQQAGNAEEVQPQNE